MPYYTPHDGAWWSSCEADDAALWAAKARTARAEGSVWTVNGNRYTKVNGKIRRAPKEGSAKAPAANRNARPAAQPRGKAPATPPGGKPAPARVATSAARAVAAILAEPARAKPHLVARAINSLSKLSKPQIAAIAAQHGLPTLRGDVRRQAERLVEESRKHLTTRREWDRKARQAGVKPADMARIAKATRDSAREYVARASTVIREAREMWQSRTGARLTRNHPAFRGGDPATLGAEFELIARALERSHPGALGGDPDDSTECARQLYDLILAGAPRPIGYADSYRAGIEVLLAGGSPPPRRRGPAVDFDFGHNREEIPW